MSVKFPNIKINLTGGDGNAFAVIGAVSKALKRAGEKDAAAAFTKEAFAAPSYDAVLQLCMRTVVVS